MKVALVAEWVDGWRGGAETSTLQFMYHLLEAGIELHVFTRSRPSPTPHMHIHTISGASMSRTRQSVTFAHRVDWLLQQQSFDVVHAISPCRRADIYQPRGGTIAETIERNMALRKNQASRLIKRYANYFNLKQQYTLTREREILASEQGPVVIAISRYVSQQLQRHYHLPPSRIRLIFNGVNPDPSTPAQRRQDREAIRHEFHLGDVDCLVLMIAHNFRLKGVQRWMEALAMLVQKGITDVRSLVIGKGDTARWHRRAARLGITPYLIFTGPTDRIRQFLHAGDVLVHPTYYDPCSRVVLEAITAGLPVITSRFDGASEIIQHGESGYVLDDPWNTTALAGYVDGLRAPAQRHAMSAVGNGVADQISMAKHARQIIDLYKELAGSPRTHR